MACLSIWKSGEFLMNKDRMVILTTDFIETTRFARYDEEVSTLMD